MANREPLSKKVRFNVFKRDNFTCQYCGKHPPNIILEVDHIQPVSKNGSNNIENLITSCFDCNRGKSADELSVLPQQTSEKLELIKEKEEQYKQYQKMLSSVEKRIRLECEQISECFSSYFPDKELTEGFKNSSVRRFILELGFNEVLISMQSACSRMNYSSDSTKYFCGICWSKIKN